MNNGISKLWWWVFTVLSFLGVADALYLTVSHFTNTEVLCSLLEGCDVVLSGPYSIFFGVPVSLIGVLYYILLFFGGLFILSSLKTHLHKYILSVPLLGFVATLYFVYLQLFVIGEICLYCMISAGITTILATISGYALYYLHYKKD